MKRNAWLLGCVVWAGCDDGGLGPQLSLGDAAPVDAVMSDAVADATVADARPPVDMTPLPTPGPDEWPQFAFPVHVDDRGLLRETLILGVDHDPVPRDGVLCMDHAGRNFPFCYDEHTGTDYLLTGGFDAMDRGSARVVAAAGGVVVFTEDGNYDRCHGSVDGGIDCDGNPMVANAIYLEHANGYRSHYLHLMRDSLLVEVGDVVECGQPLALVGSSGRSAQPHLHFHVRGPDEGLIDPYAGEFSQPESFWAQPPTMESRLPGAACHPAWTRLSVD